MKITRRFTTGVDPLADFAWERRDSIVYGTDNKVVFRMDGIEVPSTWSQSATDVLASKYLRRAGVPVRKDDIDYLTLPEGRWEEDKYIVSATGEVLLGAERSMKQVAHRLALAWFRWGNANGYFDVTSQEEARSFYAGSDDKWNAMSAAEQAEFFHIGRACNAQIFYEEIVYMLVAQIAAPNSPQWFNVGLWDAYGIAGTAQNGHFCAEHATGAVSASSSAYERPQLSACFIQSVDDRLVGDGGIMDLWEREALLFKYGSGTGTNFSTLRASDEPLSSGGKSSGLMSWLRIGDTAAGAVKSGGTTRRAAKMIILDADHPNILEYIRLKAREELKVAAMVEGHRALMDSDPDYAEFAKRVSLDLTFDFNGEAYQSVNGQNGNYSVRLTDEFMRKATNIARDVNWSLRRRVDGAVVSVVPASSLFDDVVMCAWRCADPGAQFDTTIQQWHTCPNSGRINASNPCSEFLFLDNTACNLASLNLLKFWSAGSSSFDVGLFEHAVDLWSLVLEISNGLGSYPSEVIARNSWQFRPLGLGYANLGALLMRMGVAYDSDCGRAMAAAVTAMLTGRAYLMSAKIASTQGPFHGYADNRDAMLRVMRNHYRAAGVSVGISVPYEGLSIEPVGINHIVLTDMGKDGRVNADEIQQSIFANWRQAIAVGEIHGFRNSQMTVIAPTGTIGLVMDCDTTGVEPDFALVKFKKLSGGGYMKIVNASVGPALTRLGYTNEQREDILRYMVGTSDVFAKFQTDSLAGRAASLGYSEKDVAQWAKRISGVVHIDQLDPAGPDRVGLVGALKASGLIDSQIDEINHFYCGRGTIEFAPHLRGEHYPVFDCANKCGQHGTRSIFPMAHVHMLAAVQPFVSGSISKTINMDNDVTVEDVHDIYVEGWRLALKCLAVYRDGSKRSQPLNSKMDTKRTGVSTQSLQDEIAQLTAALSKSPALQRRRLADTCRTLRHKFQIGQHEGYIHVGLFDDGTPGELFIRMSKEGSMIAGLAESFAICLSLMLQYGVPLEVIVRKFAHQRFEPHGPTAYPDIPFAKSIVDYVARWLGCEFILGYRNANGPHRETAVKALPGVPETHTSATATMARLAPPTVVDSLALTSAGLVQTDAPPCSTCGAQTVRSGTCHRCLNCGGTEGCS